MPALLLFDQAGNLMTENGVELIQKDIVGKHFPWTKYVEKAKEELLVRIDAYDKSFIEVGCKQLALMALKVLPPRAATGLAPFWLPANVLFRGITLIRNTLMKELLKLSLKTLKQSFQ